MQADQLMGRTEACVCHMCMMICAVSLVSPNQMLSHKAFFSSGDVLALTKWYLANLFHLSNL